MAAVASMSPAVAATSDDQWWYDIYGVAEAHAEGWTGEGVKIAVIDSQINPDLPVFEGADLTVAPGAACVGTEPTSSEPTENARHGSSVTAMLIGNGTGAAGIRGIVPDASVTFYGSGATDDCEVVPEASASQHSAFGWLIQRALDDGADIISISLVGGRPGVADDATVADAIARQIPIVAGGPNYVFNEGVWPFAYFGVVGVNAIDRDQNFAVGSLGVPNKLVYTSVVAPGSGIRTIGDENSWDGTTLAVGSSLATPQVAGILAAGLQKYPTATGNQLLQSLAHNTSGSDGQAVYNAEDGFGYGVASLRGVLGADPLQYDDVNPMMNKLEPQTPSAELIAAAEAALATAEPTAEPDQPGAAPESKGVLPIVIGVGVGILILIIAAVIVTVVLIRRSNRTH